MASKYTFMSLVVILGGAVGYVIMVSGFTLTAYSWAFAYLITIVTTMVYIKHMVTNLGLNSWGLVLYNNLLSLMLALVFWILTGEYGDVFSAARNVGQGRQCQQLHSLDGVVNKFLIVFINVLIWENHATTFILIFLMTIIGGVFYQQSMTIAPAPRIDNGISMKMEGVKDHEDVDVSKEGKCFVRKYSAIQLIVRKPEARKIGLVNLNRRSNRRSICTLLSLT